MKSYFSELDVSLDMLYELSIEEDSVKTYQTQIEDAKDKCAGVVSMLSVLQNRSNQQKISNTTDLTLTKDSSNTSNVRTSDTQPNVTSSSTSDTRYIYSKQRLYIGS